ncbi:MAG TPA: ATP-binding protein, partial [Anaeromyxobacteraceae bacterium]|nr:ATP-binding protein [Anaeromyxobacteraceae bacterium]
PLDELAVAAETLAEERGVRLPEPEERELANLVRAFNHMSERLDGRRHENEKLIAELEERVRRKARDLLRADRLATLGGIAAGFAHELGNSLNVIRGFASVATRELPADHPNRPDVDAIRREVTRAAGLIERFLVFARARDANSEVQDVVHILKEVVEVVGPAAAQARVERHLDVPVDLPPLLTDVELLRQAVLNLCVNAIQAMQESGKGGNLTVRARAEGGGAFIEVADDGPGMDPETTKHVFEPFFTTKASGTGLGLAIVRQAAEAHGGQVEVESVRGKGATFRIRIPAPPEQEG